MRIRLLKERGIMKKKEIPFYSFRNGDNREEFLSHYLPLVISIVKGVYKRIPQNAIEFDELVSVGVIGLVGAMDNFDVSLGLKFTTYAIPRIKGAIYDELRRLDFLPRSARDKSKLYKRTRNELANRFGREPYSEEIAKKMNVPLSALHFYQVSNFPQISIYEEFGGDNENGNRLIDILQDSVSNPENKYEVKERRNILKRCINNLDSKEKVIVGLFYIEGIAFKEISKIFGTTESRISQIHTGALEKIKSNLNKAY